MNSFIVDLSVPIDDIRFPGSWCVMALEAGEMCLHLGLTPNAKQRFRYLQESAKEDAGIGELMSTATRVRFWEMDSAIDALIGFKALMQQLHPSMQSSYRPWQNYVYLAISAWNYPFIRISSDTQDDWLYVGPFRSRFFLVDLIDTMARILRLPRCETGEWPCDKLDDGLCGGYCRSLSEKETEQQYSLEKLDSLLKESFLHPDNGVLELVKNEYDKYFDELEFEKAELLKDEIELLEKYRDWLIFLYSARHLDWEEEGLWVERGRIRRCRYQGKDYFFAQDSTDYRENESLALNLDSVDEARILFEYYQKKHKV